MGVSRKISVGMNAFREVVERIRPEGYSVIVRTESRDKKEKDLKRDLKQLVKNHQRLLKNGRKLSAPSLIHKEMGMTSSVIRDLLPITLSELSWMTRLFTKRYSRIFGRCHLTVAHSTT